MQMPETIDKAFNMAIVATNAEKEEKASGQEDRGPSAKVFTVGSSRGEYRIEDIVNPGIDFNGAGIEVPCLSTGLGRHNRSGWTGPNITGLIVGLLCHLRPYRPQEGARRQDRRTMTIVSNRGK